MLWINLFFTWINNLNYQLKIYLIEYMNRKKACDIFLEYNNKIKVSIKNLNILLQMNI